MYTVLVDGDNCQCFKCVEKRFIRDSEKEFKIFFSKIGFSPRDYSKEHNYNSLTKKAKDFTKDEIIVIYKKMTEVSAYNNLHKPGKHSVYCVDCGRLHKKLLWVKEGPICQKCAEGKYKICDNCGNIHRRELFSRAIKDKKLIQICGTCKEKYFMGCTHCGSFIQKEMSKKVTIGQNQIVDVCENCAKKTRVCRDCGFMYFIENMIGMGDGLVCQDCHVIATPVHGYGYKPIPRYKLNEAIEKTVRRDSLLFGVEWEVENDGKRETEDVAMDVKNLMGRDFVYCKHDGTIRNGFEIVTHPFSWDAFQKYIPKWEELTAMFKKLKVVNACTIPGWTSTCGIHIHMTKKAFTTVHLYKFMNFIYNEENRKFVVDISQRGGENRYASFNRDDHRHIKTCVRDKVNFTGDRRNAVNLMPPHTVEIRIFASTVVASEFFKNIEFVHSLFMFTLNESISKVTLKNYLLFVKENEKSYPNLAKFIKDNKLNKGVK